MLQVYFVVIMHTYKRAYRLLDALLIRYSSLSFCLQNKDIDKAEYKHKNAGCTLSLIINISYKCIDNLRFLLQYLFRAQLIQVLIQDFLTVFILLIWFQYVVLYYICLCNTNTNLLLWLTLSHADNAVKNPLPAFQFKEALIIIANREVVSKFTGFTNITKYTSIFRTMDRNGNLDIMLYCIFWTNFYKNIFYTQINGERYTNKPTDVNASKPAHSNIQ